MYCSYAVAIAVIETVEKHLRFLMLDMNTTDHCGNHDFCLGKVVGGIATITLWLVTGLLQPTLTLRGLRFRDWASE